ncbi:MAG: type I secretion C-terminal target domain-containing protein, partial [Leptolyngbyaceae bacterium]|nr:type I secretion C-terminal target domain-containing protein [Leptolyngbyaceae bacterium]
KGKDRYVFGNANEGVDKIRGFELGGDRIDLSDIFKGRNFSSRRPFNDYIELTQRGSRTVVNIDSNGDRTPDQFRPIAILTGIDASDLSAKSFIL